MNDWYKRLYSVGLIIIFVIIFMCHQKNYILVNDDLFSYLLIGIILFIFLFPLISEIEFFGVLKIKKQVEQFKKEVNDKLFLLQNSIKNNNTIYFDLSDSEKKAKYKEEIKESNSLKEKEENKILNGKDMIRNLEEIELKILKYVERNFSLGMLMTNVKLEKNNKRLILDGLSLGFSEDTILEIKIVLAGKIHKNSIKKSINQAKNLILKYQNFNNKKSKVLLMIAYSPIKNEKTNFIKLKDILEDDLKEKIQIEFVDYSLL